jgi:hypothetical protein
MHLLRAQAPAVGPVCCMCAGTVSGVQASLQSAFEILSFVAGAVVSSPQQFHWLMAGSSAAVAAAAGLYHVWAIRDYWQVVHGRQSDQATTAAADVTEP